MADPMRIRAQAQGDKATVRVLMSHEMESGQRKDASGNLVPAWHIQDVSASLNGKQVFSCEWGPAVSKNPFLQFVVKGAKAGDTKTGQTSEYLSAGKRHSDFRSRMQSGVAISPDVSGLPIAISSHLNNGTDDPGKRTECRSTNNKGSLRCPCWLNHSHSMVAGGLLDTS